MSASVTFPWPSADLSPNARHAHWAQQRKASTAARSQAYWIAEAAKLPAMPEDGEIMLSIVFNPPSRRRYDLDGLLSRAKPLLDGLADAMSVNDYRFGLTLRRGEPVAGGAVVVTIE